MKKYLFLFILISILCSVVAYADTIPITVRPKIGGVLQNSSDFSYVFNFTSNVDCTGVLLSYSEVITTDNYGIGFTEIDISSLIDNPKYLCEYRNGSLRKVHNISSGLFDKIRTNNNTNISGTLDVNGISYFRNSVKIEGNLSFGNNVYIYGDTLNNILKIPTETHVYNNMSIYAPKLVLDDNINRSLLLRVENENSGSGAEATLTLTNDELNGFSCSVFSSTYEEEGESYGNQTSCEATHDLCLTAYNEYGMCIGENLIQMVSDIDVSGNLDMNNNNITNVNWFGVSNISMTNLQSNVNANQKIITNLNTLKVDSINSTAIDQGINLNSYYISIPNSAYLNLFNGKFIFNNTGTRLDIPNAYLNFGSGLLTINSTSGVLKTSNLINASQYCAFDGTCASSLTPGYWSKNDTTNSIWYSNGPVGVGRNNPTHTFEVNSIGDGVIDFFNGYFTLNDTAGGKLTILGTGANLYNGIVWINGSTDGKGSLSIGTTDPVAKFNIWDTVTATDTFVGGGVPRMTSRTSGLIDYPFNDSEFYLNTVISTTTSEESTDNYTGLVMGFRSELNHFGNGTMGNMMLGNAITPAAFSLTNEGYGTIDVGIGSISTVENVGDGDMNIAVARMSSVDNIGDGNIELVAGHVIGVINDGNGIITEAYDISIDPMENNGGGSIGTAYGLYIDEQSVADENYNLYSVGVDTMNYFEGNISVGGGTFVVYYCNGGTYDGFMTINSSKCSGGSGIATKLSIG